MLSLNRLYLLPNNYLFRVLSFIQTYFKIVCLSMFILIISYPLYRYLYESYSHKELLLNRQRLTEEVEQEYKLYQSVSQYHQQLAEKEQYVSLLNQQLQIIFTDNQVKPEQLQWELEQEKSIYFSVTHQVSNIFKLIRILSENSLLKFKTIHLIKLKQDKQLQLKANVIVTEDKNE